MCVISCHGYCASTQCRLHHYAVRALYNCNLLVTSVLSILYAGQIINLLVLSFTLLPHVAVDSTCFPVKHDGVADEYYTGTMCVSLRHPLYGISHPSAARSRLSDAIEYRL